MGMEDDFLLEDEDDQKTIEFIKNYLPQDLKDKFTEDDLYYILDVIVDYYTSSGCLDVQPDEEGYINITPYEKSSFYACLATSKDNILLTLSQLQNYEKLF